MASRRDQKEQARAERLAAERADQATAKRRTAILRLGLVVGLAAVVVVVAIVLSSGGSDTASNPGGATTGDAAQARAQFAGIPQQGVTLGDKQSAPTLIEFADLQCPFCKQYNDQAMPTVVDKYVRTGKLRYELRLRSFLGADSATAAGGAAAAAKENKLYQFADLFYKRQGEENSGYVTDSFLRGVASGAGADPDAASAAAKNPKQQPLVAAAEAKAEQLGSNSTPAFYLRLNSGRLVPVNPADLDAASFTRHSTRRSRRREPAGPADPHRGARRDRARHRGLPHLGALRRPGAALRRRRRRLREGAVSDYADLVGVPVAVLGLIGYALLLATLALPEEPRPHGRRLPALVGVGFSAWLTYAEVAKIDAICQWCVASAVVMTLLAVVSIIRLLRVD